MKRMFKIINASAIILMASFSLLHGQDKKSEEKLKIIVDDGSGKKVVIDTLFKDSQSPDSIKLKDGSVIFLKHSRDEADLRHHKGKDHFYVTYSGDGKDEGKEVKEMTIISSDSLHMKKSGDNGDVMYYYNSGTNEGNEGEKYKVITWDSNENGEKGKTIYIHKGKRSEKEPENTFDVYVSDRDSDSNVDKSRYVIAKDGMVVTVEGTDEAKTKELVREIQDKLGIKSAGTEKKEAVKAESKKAMKK